MFEDFLTCVLMFDTSALEVYIISIDSLNYHTNTIVQVI